jgi:hypothetical protein
MGDRSLNGVPGSPDCTMAAASRARVLVSSKASKTIAFKPGLVSSTRLISASITSTGDLDG